MVTVRIWFTAAQKVELGSDGRTGKVLRPSRGRWKGRTRPASGGFRGPAWPGIGAGDPPRRGQSSRRVTRVKTVDNHLMSRARKIQNRRPGLIKY